MSGQSSFKNKLGQGVTLRLAGGYVVLILVIIVVAVMGMNSVTCATSLRWCSTPVFPG